MKPEIYLRELLSRIELDKDIIMESYKYVHQSPLCVSKYKPSIEEILKHQKYLIKNIKRELKYIDEDKDGKDTRRKS